MIKKLIFLIIIILFLESCIIPSLSGLKQNIIKSNYYNEQTNDGVLPPAEQWNKTFKEYGWGNYIRETSDGGYKIISNIWDNPYDNLVIAFIKTDKDANIEWKKEIDLFEVSDMLITSILETSDGGYLFAGSFGGYRGDVRWDEGIFLLKTDENGNEEWNFKYDYHYNNRTNIKYIDECPDGGFILGCNTYYDYDNYDILLIKFYRNGNIQWTSKIERENEELTYIYPTDDRGFLMGGSIYNDMWILKLDKLGIEKWEVIFEEGHGDVKEYVKYIHPAFSQEYLIVVDTIDSNYFRVIEIDNLGNEISNKSFNGGSILSIQKTDDDGFIVFFKKAESEVHLIYFSSTGSYGYLSSFKYIDYRDGWIYSKVIRKTSDDGYILLIGTFFDGFWLIKIDSLGNKLWENNIDVDTEMKDSFYCHDIDETSDGGYIICGNHNYFYEEGSYPKLWLIKLGENNPPTIPLLEGRTEGIINEDYTFSASSTDFEEDKISYFFDWGDGTDSSWTKYYLSGIKVNVTHNWTNEGTYNVKVKAKDEHGFESDWATLAVSMPKSKVINTPLFLQRLIQRFPLFKKILNLYSN